MNTTPKSKNSASVDDIPAYETLYQQALKNDEEFHVLKDIREAINKLKKSVEENQNLTVERIIPG